MTATGMEPLADISDCDAVYQYVHDVIDDDNEPAGQPRWCVRMKSGFRTFGPGRAAWPGPILQPRNMARQVPAIDNEMRTTYDSERVDVLRYEEKRQKVEEAMHERGE
jgi:hypothetical protein